MSVRTAEVLSNVAELELLQAPGVSFIIPKEYRSLPQLKGEPAMHPVQACFWLAGIYLFQVEWFALGTAHERYGMPLTAEQGWDDQLGHKAVCEVQRQQEHSCGDCC